MHEIEVKILEIDPAAIRARLLALGAERIFDGWVESVFLRNERGDKLRLRRMGKRNFITHKTPIASETTKSSDEQETEIGDVAVMEMILTRTGWEVYARTAKHRESYHFGDVSYELDTIEGIPTYLEVEAKSEEVLRKAVETLGYSIEDTVPFGEGKIRERYGRGIGPTRNPVPMDGSLLEDAIRLLVTRFPREPQKKPVLFHSIRTASMLYSLGFGESVCIAGLLHDALEDTDISYETVEERYGKHTAGIVLANSKDPETSKDRQLEDIVIRCARHSEDALAVKATEVYDNWVYYTRRLAAGDPTESEIERCRTIARFIEQYKPEGWEKPAAGLIGKIFRQDLG